MSSRDMLYLQFRHSRYIFVHRGVKAENHGPTNYQKAMILTVAILLNWMLWMSVLGP